MPINVRNNCKDKTIRMMTEYYVIFISIFLVNIKTTKGQYRDNENHNGRRSQT